MKYYVAGVELKDIQNAQLEILLEFDRICKKHGIKYQLFAGTLLGAVRHKGFIPWDDDIDVCVLRQDYIRLVKVCKRDLKPDFFLQTYKTDENYVMPFAKLRKNDTVFLEEATAETEIHKGVFIDIFPLDKVFPNQLKGSLQRHILFILSKVNLCRIKRLCLDIKNPLMRSLSLTLHYCLKSVPNAWVNVLFDKIISRFEKEDSNYVSHLTNGTSKDRYERYMMKKVDFLDSTVGEFEGYNFPIPENYHKILSNLFGDYMKFPPEEEQSPHHGVIKVDLGNTRKIN